MTTHPIGNLDVRLMRTLLILLTECSVSRTADILGQAQPTISLTLKRLREIFDDPLLVRSGNSLVPTERGMDLRVAMEEILGRIDAHLAPRTSFNPASSTRGFRIVTSNCLGTVFLPPLIGQIGSLAPKVSLDVSPMPEHEDMLSGLSDGTIDAVIGNWPRPPQHLRIAPILTTDIVCLVRPSHPFARRKGRIRMDEYLLEKHLSPTSRRHAHLSPIDGRLIELGLTRQISATVPEYAIAPYILAQSNLMFTTGRHFAEQVAQTFPFAVLDAPEELGQMQFYLLWHERNHHSSDQLWLRGMIKKVAGSMRSLDSVTLPPLPAFYTAPSSQMDNALSPRTAI